MIIVTQAQLRTKTLKLFMFKNEADAQYVIDNPNFRDILDNIFKV